MYNTVLGSKPIEADGRAFYYSDYNTAGTKAYFQDRWPCCSGTLPQIAADYGISTYLRDAQGVFVNLYLPSRVRWQQHGAAVQLSQTGDYPLGNSILLTVKTSQSREFALRLRIPEWSGEGTQIRVNGKRIATPAVPGHFASVARTWQTGDRVELELPLPMHLERVDAQHPNLVALLRGPLVMFGIDAASTAVTRPQLLAAQRTSSSSSEWTARTDAGLIRLLPFTAIRDERYTTYLKISD